jgi:hypothetical protein
MTISSASQPIHTRRERIQVFLIAVAGISSFLILASFFTARLTVLGDGTQVIFPMSGLVGEGLLVRPLVPMPDGLQSNDIVTAIDGHLVNDLIRDAFTGRWTFGSLLQKSNLEYTLLRGGKLLSVRAALASFPIVSALQESWGISLSVVWMFGIGAFVFIRSPYSLPARLFFLACSLLAAGTVPWAMGHQTSDLLRGWVIPFETAANNVLYYFGIAALLHFALIFPRPHPLLVKYPRLVIWVYLGIWIISAVSILLRPLVAATPAALLQLRVQSTNGSVLYSVLIVLAIFSNLRLLKNRTEIRQLRWVAWGMLVGFGAMTFAVFLAILLGLPIQTFLGVAGLFVLAMPVSIAIAILQENLFDINLILNRTLVYVPLTAILAGLIAAFSAFSQKLFVGLTGAESDAAFLLTTLFIVAIFTPIKERLQKFVDRHFKEVPDPLKELRAYRAETQLVLQVIDPEAVAKKTLDVAVHAFNAEGGAIFMGNESKPVYTVGKWQNANAFRVPLIADDGQFLACLALAGQRDGEAYTDQDRVTLQENLDLSKRALILTQYANY